MLSVHPRIFSQHVPQDKQAAAYKKGWEMPGSCLLEDHIHSTGREQLNTANPHIVAKLICEYAWSPICWSPRERKGDNFAAALWCALDFDSGEYTLERALDDVTSAGLMHVIGTTKSHGLEKGGDSPQGQPAPACDRFRLLLRFERVVTDRKLFERAMRAAMETFPHADKSCKDAARFYFPCKEIVSAARGHPFWPIDEDQEEAGPAPPRADRPRRTTDYASKAERPKSTSRPQRNRLLDIVEVEGIYEPKLGRTSKHDTMLHTVPGLRRRGYSDSECFEYLRGKFPADRDDKEIWDAIRWWDDKNWQN